MRATEEINYFKIICITSACCQHGASVASLWNANQGPSSLLLSLPTGSKLIVSQLEDSEIPDGEKNIVMAHLVDEGSKLVVEGLDLFPFLSPHSLDGGVNLQVQRSEEILVDSDLLDASRWADREAPIATTKASSTTKPKATTSSTAKTKSAPGSSSKAIATSDSAATSTPCDVAAPSNGDPLGAPQAIEAPAAKASSSTGPTEDTTAPGAGH